MNTFIPIISNGILKTNKTHKNDINIYYVYTLEK